MFALTSDVITCTMNMHSNVLNMPTIYEHSAMKGKISEKDHSAVCFPTEAFEENIPMASELKTFQLAPSSDKRRKVQFATSLVTDIYYIPRNMKEECRDDEITRLSQTYIYNQGSGVRDLNRNCMIVAEELDLDDL